VLKMIIEDRELKKQMGERFRQARQHIGLSQLELGNLLGLTQSNIARIETGRVFPRLSVCHYLRWHHTISLNWLITGKGEMVLKDEDVVKKMDFGEYESEVRDMVYYLAQVPGLRYPVIKLFMDYKLDHKKEIYEALQKREEKTG
jgi:transcriptional regulator with XRE-family HTH domain